MCGFGYACKVISSDGISYNYIGAQRQSDEQINGKTYKRRISSYRCHCNGSHIPREFSYYGSIGSIKELLQYTRQCQGQSKF